MNVRYIYSLFKPEQLWSRKKFQLAKNTSQPMLVNWQGILPVIEEYTYTLTAINFTVELSSESDRTILNKIKKNHPEATHAIACAFHKLGDRFDRITTLFSLTIKANDLTAEKLSQYLATVISNCQPQSKKFLLTAKYNRFWQDLAKLKLSEINPSAILFD